MNYKEMLLRKILLKNELEQRLSERSIRKALSNGHAKRKPRPCGLTIHSAIGCPNECLYCYIQDMGFDFIEAKPYGLSGEELLYSLMNNPYFVPGKWGTFLAFGSISDPFHEEVIDKTLEYFTAIEKIGNPCQFSTKKYIDRKVAKRLASLKISISPLITIISINKSSILEPKAPKVEARLKTIENLRKVGLKPILFLRPIIPGISDLEFNEIMKEAKRAGAIGVVVGGLRITMRIINRLRRAGINVKPILNRAPRIGIGDRQIPIRISDLKRKAISEARRIGLIPFASACCANAYIAGVPCANLCWLKGQCTKCPNNCSEKVPKIVREDAEELFRMITKRKAVILNLNERGLSLRVKDRMNRREIEIAQYIMQIIFRRRVKIEKS